MSEQTAFCTSEVEMFIPLLNEGTNVIRPTKGLVLGENRYKVLATPSYSPTIEEWQFPPGSVVSCVLESHAGREVLVARKKIS